MSDAELRAIEAARKLTDPVKLRVVMANARTKGAEQLFDVAFARLCSIQPSEAPGTLEYDVWQSVFALEEMLKLDRGKTTLLARTRQKIARDGEVKTVADLSTQLQPSEGFHMLIELRHPELLFEAVVLRHPDRFDNTVQQAARIRLEDAGVSIERVTGEHSGGSYG